MDRDVIETVQSDDFGGLQFVGTRRQLLQTALDMHDAISNSPVMHPNYLSDFVFALEVRCQELGMMNDCFDPIYD